MRNGLFLFLIIFLVSVGIHVNQGIMFHQDYFAGGLYFIALSLGIAYLTTHFKRSVALLPVQKFINIAVLGVFAAYGILTGVSLVELSAASAAVGAEGYFYIIGGAIVLYSFYRFYVRDQKIENRLQTKGLASRLRDFKRSQQARQQHAS